MIAIGAGSDDSLTAEDVTSYLKALEAEDELMM